MAIARRRRGREDRRVTTTRRTAMTGPLYHIGRFCTRHHWPVIVAWVVAVGALVAFSHTVGTKTSDNLNLPGTGSTKATDRLQNKLPDQANGSNPLVIKTE